MTRLRNYKSVGIDTLLKICKVLDCKIEEILETK
ncbi:MAG: helix-turn-helix transcriptional regulator [Erysipelotrichaceae bacterium]|nr:helix-turn-helix transcriptional regulator [Erysipelotrichaceae bacterium]